MRVAQVILSAIRATPTSASSGARKSTVEMMIVREFVVRIIDVKIHPELDNHVGLLLRLRFYRYPYTLV